MEDKENDLQKLKLKRVRKMADVRKNENPWLRRQSLFESGKATYLIT
jgi:hypothetical protein